MAESQPAHEAGFDTIGHGIYLKRALAIQTLEDTYDHPTIILLFGWMGAKLPHLLKYTQGYDKLYPSATQILVRCEPSTFWSPGWMKRSTLRPALEALAALGVGTVPSKQKGGPNSHTTQHRILAHAFSNGGCLQLMSLARYLSQQTYTNVTTGALIFDSCPGTGSLRVSLRAFSSVIHFAPLRYLVAFHLSMFYFFALILRYLFSIPLYWEAARTKLNEPGVLPWLRKSSPRLYIYSTGDELVPWQDVESHAKGAEKSCADVRTEKFEKSMHVAHMRQDPERYWGAVGALWNAACQAL